MEEPAAATHRGERTAAAESGYLSMSAAVLGEHGMVRLREPLDAKLFDLAVRLLDGTYPKPFVIDHEGMRRLHFNLAHIQSEMRIAEPDALCAGYTQAMMSFVLFRPRPRHVMLMGLGGGSLAKTCHRHLPGAALTAVEMDADVIGFRDLFCIPPDDSRWRVERAEAHEYLIAARPRTDVILLDVYDSKGLSASADNAGFYRDLRGALRPGGLLVANVLGSSDQGDAHLALIGEAFEARPWILEVRDEDNRIAFAFADPPGRVDWPAVRHRALEWSGRLGFDLAAYADQLRRRWASREEDRD
ncbi:MAG: spermidine synthase [Betaproteobacteria bacterium]|nr:spermidine synthase [Betaproteobacteria bacterium]